MVMENKLLLCKYDINNIQRKRNAENMMHPATTHFMQFGTKSIKLVLIYFFFLANA